MLKSKSTLRAMLAMAAGTGLASAAALLPKTPKQIGRLIWPADAGTFVSAAGKKRMLQRRASYAASFAATKRTPAAKGTPAISGYHIQYSKMRSAHGRLFVI